MRTVNRTLDLPPGDVCVVAVSDTHSHPHRDALKHIASRSPAAILHGGDIGALEVLDDLATVAPVIAVRGNIDGKGDGLPDVVDLTINRDGQTLKLVMTHIAVRGPRLRADARRLALRHEASVLVCGHSHVPLLAMDGRVAVFNPGSIGPRRFTLPITFGVLAFGTKGLSFRHVDCETGERWDPPAP